jgi:hypothetical protein
MLRTSIYCLGIALAMRVAFDLTAQEVSVARPDKHTYLTDKKAAVEWHFHDEYRVWLSVNAYNGYNWAEEGYHPSFTYVLCNYKPVVRKLPNGSYQITFVSGIAGGENVP